MQIDQSCNKHYTASYLNAAHSSYIAKDAQRFAIAAVLVTVAAGVTVLSIPTMYCWHSTL